MSKLEDDMDQINKDIKGQPLSTVVPLEELQEGVEYKLLCAVVAITLKDYSPLGPLGVSEEIVTIEIKESGSIALISVATGSRYILGNGHYGTKWILLNKKDETNE